MIDYTDDEVVKAVLVRMAQATVASCTCRTKSPDIAVHAASCRYRALMEGMAVIDAFQLREQERRGL